MSRRRTDREHLIYDLQANAIGKAFIFKFIPAIRDDAQNPTRNRFPLITNRVDMIFFIQPSLKACLITSAKSVLHLTHT